MSETKFPRVMVSSVIRTANAGQSHGGLYIVDLEDGSFEQVINWDDTNISFRDRGAERGLRGLALYGEHIYVTSCDSLMVYDRQFNKLEEYANPYLFDCHETWVEGNFLYVTSTFYDSVLVFDLEKKRFTDGYCFRNDFDRVIKKAMWKVFGMQRAPGLRAVRFDPNSGGGPRMDDVLHLNSIYGADGVLYLSSYRTKSLYAFRDGRLEVVSPLPEKTHNARRFRDGVLFANTGDDEAIYSAMDGAVRHRYPAVKLSDEELKFADLPDHIARTGFVRGLTVFDDRYVIFGVSPAMILVYDIETAELVKTVVLSRDVRNAVHGVEIFPDL